MPADGTAAFFGGSMPPDGRQQMVWQSLGSAGRRVMQSMAAGSCQILDLPNFGEICHAKFRKSRQFSDFRAS